LYVGETLDQPQDLDGRIARHRVSMTQIRAELSFVRNDGGASLRNRVLANLSFEDFSALRPYLQRVETRARSILQEANKRVEHVHFIEHGLVSRVSGVRACSMETAMVGRFGYTGVAIVLGSTLSSQRSIVCLSGTALRIRSDELSRIFQTRPQIRTEMLQYVQSLITQNTQGVFCAAKHEVDQRLARWLLLASDRMQNDALTVTHDLLAMTMGVRRAGVTNALLQFESDGVLKKKRGAVHITDRSALERRACDCYGIIRDAYARWNRPECSDPGPDGSLARSRSVAGVVPA
jgi:CRP-like cAMP-binding protein